MRLAMPTARTRLWHAGSKDHKDQIVDGSTKGIQKRERLSKAKILLRAKEFHKPSSFT